MSEEVESKLELIDLISALTRSKKRTLTLGGTAHNIAQAQLTADQKSHAKIVRQIFNGMNEVVNNMFVGNYDTEKDIVKAFEALIAKFSVKV